MGVVGPSILFLWLLPLTFPVDVNIYGRPRRTLGGGVERYRPLLLLLPKLIPVLTLPPPHC